MATLGGYGLAMPEPRPLTEPGEGIPEVTATPERLHAACEALAAGHGPVAVDAERASGYRYGQSAYLVQLRRAGSGTVLIDPVPLPNLEAIGEALADAEWVLHSASQDLPCLAEVGLRPGGALFDTELAGRIAGLERVGLAAIVEAMLGWQLAKEHSAVDWSTRPLPTDWLRYAALDVEVLVDLRDALVTLLSEQGKLEWAMAEFEAVRDAPPRPPRTDPWRRTSGMHQLRSRRQLGVLRELWTERDTMARRRDLAPGRLLPDRALVAASSRLPTTVSELTALPVFSGPANRRIAHRWLAAITRGMTIPDRQLPPMTAAAEGPPPPRAWRDRDSSAADRLTAARAAVAEISERHSVPVENLLSPDALRRLCWSPPNPVTRETVTEALTGLGARRWQVDLLAGAICAALEAAACPTPSAPA
jgi:ribonuclease D